MIAHITGYELAQSIDSFVQDAYASHPLIFGHGRCVVCPFTYFLVVLFVFGKYRVSGSVAKSV